MSRLLNFNQTSFLMFETTWQILCSTGQCVSRKNGSLKPLSFTKICTYLTHFDIPALIMLHTYNLSICDKRQNVHRGVSFSSKHRLMRLGFSEYFLRTFTCLLLSFCISDHFAFVICVVLICYWFN